MNLSREVYKTDGFDYAFWMGDMNYKINLEYDEAINLITNKEYTKLFKFDQLHIEIENNTLDINGFSEGMISHQPTYKFRNEQYDLEKVPGWTDRILFKTKEALTLYSYYIIEGTTTSDHKPVYATFRAGKKSNDQFDKYCNIY